MHRTARSVPPVFFTMLLSAAGRVAARQQCYSDSGVLASNDVAPCFPEHVEAGEVSACCQVGDMCLINGVCYSSEAETTYMYGCTDESYDHENCPSKCDLDSGNSPWVGLVECHDPSAAVNGDPPFSWACYQPVTCTGEDCRPPNTRLSTIFGTPDGMTIEICADVHATPKAVVSHSPQLEALTFIPHGTPDLHTAFDNDKAKVEDNLQSEEAKDEEEEEEEKVLELKLRKRTTPAAPPSIQRRDDGDALGQGATIGLILGILGTALAAVLICLWRRRRRRQTTKKRDAETAAAVAAVHGTHVNSPGGQTMQLQQGINGHFHGQGQGQSPVSSHMGYQQPAMYNSNNPQLSQSHPPGYTSPMPGMTHTVKEMAPTEHPVAWDEQQKSHVEAAEMPVPNQQQGNTNATLSPNDTPVPPVPMSPMSTPMGMAARTPAAGFVTPMLTGVSVASPLLMQAQQGQGEAFVAELPVGSPAGDGPQDQQSQRKNTT